MARTTADSRAEQAREEAKVRTAQLLREIRRIEIQTSRLVNQHLAGSYQSVFKGQGVAFSEVRGYIPGDDVRTIDWNVTARTGEPHVKLFAEERELTVMLVVDMSASLDLGTRDFDKRNLVARLAAARQLRLGLRQLPRTRRHRRWTHDRHLHDRRLAAGQQRRSGHGGHEPASGGTEHAHCIAHAPAAGKIPAHSRDERKKRPPGPPGSECTASTAEAAPTCTRSSSRGASAPPAQDRVPANHCASVGSTPAVSRRAIASFISSRLPPLSSSSTSNG